MIDCWCNPQTDLPETYQEYCIILDDMTITTGIYTGDGDWIFFYEPYEANTNQVMYYILLPEMNEEQ
jgi:hypothetical protein